MNNQSKFKRYLKIDNQRGGDIDKIISSKNKRYLISYDQIGGVYPLPPDTEDLNEFYNNIIHSIDNELKYKILKNNIIKYIIFIIKLCNYNEQEKEENEIKSIRKLTFYINIIKEIIHKILDKRVKDGIKSIIEFFLNKDDLFFDNFITAIKLKTSGWSPPFFRWYYTSEWSEKYEIIGILFSENVISLLNEIHFFINFNHEKLIELNNLFKLFIEIPNIRILRNLQTHSS